MTAADAGALASAQLAARHTPVWYLVLRQELTELWAGGRVLNYLTVFGLLMSVTAFLLATNNELNLLPLTQTVVVSLTSAVTFGLFIGLVLAAESVSGERERATLEPLLLTPSSHRQIVLGKLLAALSPWPAALIVSVPYVMALAHGDPVTVPGLLWSALSGTVLAVAFVGLGVLVSIWSESTRVSLFVCLLAYAASLIPAQLPTEFLTSPAGTVVAAVDPVEASSLLLTAVVTDGRPFAAVWYYLAAPMIMMTIILVLLFAVAAPRLRLHPGE